MPAGRNARRRTAPQVHVSALYTTMERGGPAPGNRELARITTARPRTCHAVYSVSELRVELRGDAGQLELTRAARNALHVQSCGSYSPPDAERLFTKPHAHAHRPPDPPLWPPGFNVGSWVRASAPARAGWSRRAPPRRSPRPLLRYIQKPTKSAALPAGATRAAFAFLSPADATRAAGGGEGRGRPLRAGRHPFHPPPSMHHC